MRNPFFRISRTYSHLVRYRHIMGVLMKYGFEEVAGVFARRLKIGLGSTGAAGGRGIGADFCQIGTDAQYTAGLDTI
ncbi:MAG: hypothetical protein ACYS9H_04425 [Planctomycetota bacterium]|jgi:hypothetical protein